jgi:hypothetical protein
MQRNRGVYNSMRAFSQVAFGSVSVENALVEIVVRPLVACAKLVLERHSHASLRKVRSFKLFYTWFFFLDHVAVFVFKSLV